MIDFDYLYQGLCGLARAHRAGTMAGHLGAAVLTGYFFGEDQSQLPDAVFRGIEGELDRVIAGQEAIWFNAKKVGLTPTELFQPFPEEEPQPDAIASIVAALRQNIGTLKQSGHNVIFASAGVRALHDHPQYTTPQIVGGIRKLTQAFDSVAAGRGYYGKEKGWITGNQVELAGENDFPAYDSIQQMVDVTIDELIATAPIKKQGFGGLWHVINHAAAIAELAQYGYRDVATAGLPAHHRHVRLWRSLPDVADELGAVVKADHDPRQPVYWEGMLKRDQARLTHRIKTLYGFYTLCRLVDDEGKAKQAEDAFLYLMD
jgi:hypothetical protein